LSDLTIWDSDLIQKKSLYHNEQILTDEEKQIEDECEQERYVDLYRDMESEALKQGKRSAICENEYSNFDLEEELKRSNADKNSYNQVGFSYDQINNSKESQSKTTEGRNEYLPKNVSNEIYANNL